MSLTVEVVDAAARLQALRAKWKPVSTPFHTLEWLLTWWNCFGGGQLRAVLLWNNQDLVGIVPCFVHPWEGAQQLTLIGSGISDYLEPCVPKGGARAAASAFLNDPCWHRAVWQDLSSDSPFADPQVWPGTTIKIEEDTPCSAIPLSGDFDGYWNARSKDLRRNLRRYGDRARAEGPIAFHHSCRFEDAVLEDLIRLHALRWQHRGESGTIDANNAADFLRAAAQQMAARGILRLFWLTWTNKLVAVSLGFAWNGEIFSYLSAFDPAHEPLGFGRILLHESLRQAWNEGTTNWNFLRGEESYKASWGAQPEKKIRLTVWRTLF